MNLNRTAFAALSALAVAAGAGALALVLLSDHEPHKASTAGLAITAGLSFVAAGLIALHRRPENRTGIYLAAIGYLWFIGALSESNTNWVFTIGLDVGNLVFIPFAALVLAFPTGRLTTRADHLIFRATIVFAALGGVLESLVNSRPQPDCTSPCPTSSSVVYSSHRLAVIVDSVFTAAGLLLLAIVVVLLVVRWRRAGTALRRVLLPVYVAGGGALFVLLLLNVLSAVSRGTADGLNPIFLVLFAAIPFAFLLGVLRSRLAQGSVARLVVSIGQGTPLRDAIADALRDPTLELVYWSEERGWYVDADGRSRELPEPDSARSATIVEREGRTVGALVYDALLRDERELVESVAATVALALDNERLQTNIRLQYTLLTTVVDTAPSLLLTIDSEGHIVNLNPATLRASGYVDQEVVRGQFFWDVFIDSSEREAMIERFRLASPDFPAAEYENAFTNARGEEIVIAWRSAPLPDESGRVTRIIAGGLDITERKRQERELEWNVEQRKLQEAEVRASRTRIVAAEDEARRRLERNLHDGAQQRLVSLSLSLRLAQAKVSTEPDQTAEILAGAQDELTHALEELRELARGIHPAVLTDRGLGAALEGLAARTPVPLELTPPTRRLPESIEAAAYYLVSESVANVVKHAEASSIAVSVRADNGVVRIEVADDGIGGARTELGSGLRGLVDRLAVLDGTLTVESPAGGGTRLVAEIPLPTAVSTE